MSQPQTCRDPVILALYSLEERHGGTVFDWWRRSRARKTSSPATCGPSPPLAEAAGQEPSISTRPSGAQTSARGRIVVFTLILASWPSEA